MKCLNKINVGDVFFITNSNFQYSTIFDNYEDFEKTGDVQYKYPFLTKTDFIGNIDSEVSFAVKYLGNSKVQEMSTGRIFSIESKLIDDTTWVEPSYNGLGYKSISLDGEFFNTFNGKTGTFEPISEETYNKILEQFVSLATREPIRIATNMACPVEINEESMEDHLRNTDEERIAIINYYIAVAKGEFSREYQQVFSKVDEKMQAKANFESQLENFRKIKSDVSLSKKNN